MHCKFVASSPIRKGMTIDLGDSVHLLVGNVNVLVTELKSQLLDDEMLKLFDLYLDQFKIVAIKSSQHFRAFFERVACEIVTVDTPGISSFSLESFEFKTSARFQYPLAKS